MPDPKIPEAPTQAMPAVRNNLIRTDEPAIYQAIRRDSLPRKTPADLGLDKVSFTWKDSDGNLKNLSPMIWHDALNQILDILDDAEIG